MPGFDGTGPLGQGAMTGRGMGRCNPAWNAGAIGRGLGRGMGRGMAYAGFQDAGLQEEMETIKKKLAAIEEKLNKDS